MATTSSLTFTEDSDNACWTCSYESQGPHMVQLIRSTVAALSVAFGLGDNDPSIVKTWASSNAPSNKVIQIEAPAGVQVTLTSYSEVDTATLMYIE